MCDLHRTHITVVKGIPRCVLCGHTVFPSEVRLLDWPKELWHRHKARKAWWNQPTLYVDILRY